MTRQSKTVVELDDASTSSVEADDSVIALDKQSNESMTLTQLSDVASASEKELTQPDDPPSEDLPSGVTEGESDSFEVLLPPMLATGNTGECNVLLQIEPEEAAKLDYEGTSGAMGRFSAGDQGVVLDLNGSQYQGSLLPGPTALLVALSKGGQLRVEGITDEFATLVKTQDMMAKLDAVVTGAKLDEGYQVVDENVNRVQKDKAEEQGAPKQSATKTYGSSKRSAKPPAKATSKRRKSS